MKKILLLCGSLSFTLFSFGQAMSHGRWEENERKTIKVRVQQPNLFANAEMSVNEGLITFSDLPEVKSQILAVITDPEGAVLSQHRVSATYNTIDAGRLPKGDLYYVTLLYRGKSQKGFVLHL